MLDVPPVAPPPAPAAVKFEALPCVRLARPFEELRDASDRLLERTGARPKIFLANLGKPADFTARATFAKNFFEAGGIEAITNDGFESEDALVAAFRGSRTKLACLCSSDEVYARQAVAAAHALRHAGASVWFAGRPGALEAALGNAGVCGFIFAGCDALAALRTTHWEFANLLKKPRKPIPIATRIATGSSLPKRRIDRIRRPGVGSFVHVRVDRQRGGGRCMPEPIGNFSDWNSAGDQHRGVRVPQCVEGDADVDIAPSGGEGIRYP